MGNTRFYLAGNYNATRHFSKLFFFAIFFSLFSLFTEAIVLQNSRSFNSRKLFYCPIAMLTNNSEANIACRRQGLPSEEQLKSERQRARINCKEQAKKIAEESEPAVKRPNI